jgi:hypothetical protein
MSNVKTCRYLSSLCFNSVSLMLAVITAGLSHSVLAFNLCDVAPSADECQIQESTAPTTPTDTAPTDTAPTTPTITTPAIPTNTAPTTPSITAPATPSITAPAIPVNTAPTIPTNVTTSEVKASSITLNWNKSNDDQAVTGYKVYRNGVLLATTTSGTNYVDTTVEAGIQYSYTLAACDAQNACSSATAPISALAANSDKISVTPVLVGNIESRKISVLLTPASADIGKQASIFVGVSTMAGLFFLNSNGEWTAYTGDIRVPAYSTATLNSRIEIPVIREAVNLSPYKGALVYIGYGFSPSDYGSFPFLDMVVTARYERVLVVE